MKLKPFYGKKLSPPAKLQKHKEKVESGSLLINNSESNTEAIVDMLPYTQNCFKLK